jgi:hypothetical protein
MSLLPVKPASLYETIEFYPDGKDVETPYRIKVRTRFGMKTMLAIQSRMAGYAEKKLREQYSKDIPNETEIIRAQLASFQEKQRDKESRTPEMSKLLADEILSLDKQLKRLESNGEVYIGESQIEYFIATNRTKDEGLIKVMLSEICMTDCDVSFEQMWNDDIPADVVSKVVGFFTKANGNITPEPVNNETASTENGEQE